MAACTYQLRRAPSEHPSHTSSLGAPETSYQWGRETAPFSSFFFPLRSPALWTLYLKKLLPWNQILNYCLRRNGHPVISWLLQKVVLQMEFGGCIEETIFVDAPNFSLSNYGQLRFAYLLDQAQTRHGFWKIEKRKWALLIKVHWGHNLTSWLDHSATRPTGFPILNQQRAKNYPWWLRAKSYQWWLMMAGHHRARKLTWRFYSY